jgi:4-amino-4-deoxy-L-arabinose transferase-like glycosyltransferase
VDEDRAAVSGEAGERGRVVAWMLVALTAGALLRVIFLTADPPWQTPVGITWHDEGPWVHNARNRVLFGAWSTDAWNPMYLTPVFTALEYVAFAVAGVGTWQARLVPVTLGLASIVWLAIGTTRLGGARAGLIAAILLSTNYIYVMWNRAALMEGTMTAFIVASWCAYALAGRRPAFGVLAGLAALLAFFTKAAAAFFVGALALDAFITIAIAWHARRKGEAAPAAADVRGAWWTLAGLAIFGLVALAIFVVPFWTEFRFYNWQMSVTRKPAYSVKAFLDRASWVPIVHDFFTRQFLLTAVTVTWCLGLLARWRAVAPAERLLGLWIGLGLAELIFHDVGNERRFVFFIPAMVGITALVLGRGDRVLPASVANASWPVRVAVLPLVAYGFYIVGGALARLPWLYQVRPGVRSAAVIALVATALVYLFWNRLLSWLGRGSWPAAATTAIVGILVAGDLVQFVQWARIRTYENVEASRLVGELLPPGTLVHGKLANGLALENRIRPVFVGRGFGNYDDRRNRNDIRYVLTYVTPRIGYEGQVITDVLDAHRGWRVLRTFPVAETSGGRDMAALIEKPRP